MTAGFLQKIFGSRNQRLVKQYQKTVVEINAIEIKIKNLTDDQLRKKTDEFRQRIAAGESLDNLLPEAFSVCREASQRVLKMRHFDVQLIGGMALHYGMIAEMRTGEGKTLVATLPVYLNALPKRGVHVVTVNDYLANRDAEWMASLYNFLGLSVSTNLSGMEHDKKKQAYAADITYGTNNEYGFDYLRDNMVYETESRVQRGLNFALLDEVDSILIDEARTPLIISGHAEDQTDLYMKIDALPMMLECQIGEEKSDGTGIEKIGDYTIDEKTQQVYLTESGHEKTERILTELGLISHGESLYAAQNIKLIHHVYAALRAHTLFHRNKHYVVLPDGKVTIVDEFTGRLMPGRRWSDGLHQAIEAKERVRIQNENQTLASITFQNYFRMYEKLSGMTGTANTEAYEFNEIYNLETVVIPTNKPSNRIDNQDKIYKTAKERDNAVIRDIRECYDREQPVLVGTTSIENSELLSHLLTKSDLPHEVLNAKQHAREAAIIAEAGRPKRITIATNMAGRGTDIVLGGNAEKQASLIKVDDTIPTDEKARRIQKLYDEWETLHKKVKSVGGLHIIGTERHESRRIDNQLRGRAGRQGDPGSSRFYLSLEDPLLRIFAGDRVRAIMDRLKIPENEAIEARIVTRAIESAQRKVEARNFDIRKQLLEYDDVSNDQRKVIYQQRNQLLEAQSVSNTIVSMYRNTISSIVHQFVPKGSIEEQWDILKLEEVLCKKWRLDLVIQETLNESIEITAEEILEAVIKAADEKYKSRSLILGQKSFIEFERSIVLHMLDRLWREHLASLDYLRQGIHLRGYAQKNPKQEYKREAFELFTMMLDVLSQEVTKIIMNSQIQSIEHCENLTENIEYKDDKLIEINSTSYTPIIPTDDIKIMNTVGYITSDGQIIRVGRNNPCPCGSKKKFKNCHGIIV